MATNDIDIDIPLTNTYTTVPCMKAECFENGEFIGPHYHSTDPNDNDFLMKVDSKGNYT